MAVKLIQDAAGIEKAIKSVSTRGKKLDESIQVVGLSILAHVEKCGDTTLADRLFDAMPKSARRSMLAEWFVAFGKIRTLDPKSADDAKRIKAGAHFQFDKTRSTDMVGAEAKPWHDMKKPETAAQAFDAQASVRAVLARLTAAAKDGREVKNRAEAVKALDELRAALNIELEVPENA